VQERERERGMQWWWQRRRRRRATSGSRDDSHNSYSVLRSLSSVTLQDVLPHWQAALFLTATFGTAWAWDLVLYGASHAAARENPLREQTGFGNNGRHEHRAPQHLAVLLLYYLVACVGAALLSDVLTRQEASWSRAAVTAVEFFPSPVFAGKLVAYLGQFSYRTSVLERAAMNLAATWGAATLAHLAVLAKENMPRLCSTSRLAPALGGELQWHRLFRLGDIVRDTLGFGLGIAWNLLLSEWLVSSSSSSHKHHTKELSLGYLVGLAGYLVVVTLIAFRLTAQVAPSNTGNSNHDEQTEPASLVASIVQRQWQLSAFAAYVVVAFTLVTLLNVLLHPGWLGQVESLAVLLVLSAVVSALVTSIDFDRLAARLASAQDAPGGTCDALMEGPCGVIGRGCVFVPCAWACCPWIPLLYLVGATADGASTFEVQEHWLQLIAMVTGLASSVQASGLLTEATDALAARFGLCESLHSCHHVWLFVMLQVVMAVLTTLVLIPLVAPLAPTDATSAAVGVVEHDATCVSNSHDERTRLVV
jgi:hypothetical protein